ncbi:MAG: TIGR03905 family TSCPD domain-containing protein [Coprobacter sp.]|nr:TIGR03905 family TSCPD domain-containing protein [Coprobacter sp.]
MKTVYRTTGTCSTVIELELCGGVVKNVSFRGGCNGNLQGIGRLVEGLPAGEVIRRLDGVRCGNKSTSCPDQLCRAVEQALREQPSGE